MNNKQYIYKIKRYSSIENSYFDEESYRKAIEDDRIKELIKSGSLYCEFGRTHDYDKCVINLDNSCAKIIEISDDDITVQLIDGPLKNELSKALDENIDNFRAIMRFIGRLGKDKIFISKIITFNIICIKGKGDRNYDK